MCPNGINVAFQIVFSFHASSLRLKIPIYSTYFFISRFLFSFTKQIILQKITSNFQSKPCARRRASDRSLRKRGASAAPPSKSKDRWHFRQRTANVKSTIGSSPTGRGEPTRIFLGLWLLANRHGEPTPVFL